MSKLPSLAFALLLFGPMGCRPKIGDKCETSVDCSVQGDRLCDATQPGGYCTIFNCEPDGCPVDESQCVAFQVVLDPACGPAINSTAIPRFERSFCMAPCDDDSDCRSDGYTCVDPRSRNAEVIDSDPDSLKVCMVIIAPPSASTAPTPDGGLVETVLAPGVSTELNPPGVCEPGDAGFDAAPFMPSASGAGGAGGK